MFGFGDNPIMITANFRNLPRATRQIRLRQVTFSDARQNLAALRQATADTIRAQASLASSFLWIGFHGSLAYGILPDTLSPQTLKDIDIIGVFIGSRAHYLGLQTSPIHIPHLRIWDIPVEFQKFELRDYLRQVLKGSPSQTPFFWTDPKDLILRDPLGDTLLNTRSWFSSQQIIQGIQGFAAGNLKQVRGNKNLSNKEKFKLAYHVLRLIRMGHEMASTGTMFTNRIDIDAPELAAIKFEKRNLEEVLAQCEAELFALKQARESSSLPLEGNLQATEQEVIRVILEKIRS